MQTSAQKRFMQGIKKVMKQYYKDSFSESVKAGIARKKQEKR